MSVITCCLHCCNHMRQRAAFLRQVVFLEQVHIGYMISKAMLPFVSVHYVPRTQQESDLHIYMGHSMMLHQGRGVKVARYRVDQLVGTPPAD